MLTLLYGNTESTRTAAIAERIRQRIGDSEVLFLVPEQYTVKTERDMARILPRSAPLSFEVTNFSRLANRVFRERGGLSYRYATPGTRNLFMWRTLRELAPLLSEGGDVNTGRVKKSLAAVRELRHAGITGTALAKASERLPETHRLAQRMKDLSFMMTVYHGLLTAHYNDEDDDLDRLLSILKSEKPFRNAVFFVDSFTSFTEVEYEILLALCKENEVTVALPLPKEHTASLSYAEAEGARDRLLGAAQKRGIPYTELFLPTEEARVSPLLSFLCEALFLAAPPEGLSFRGESEEDALRLVTAPDPYAAADFLAADIRRRVMAGARYRDIAIVTENAERYDGILDIALQKNEIPFYMSSKIDILSFESIKFIFSAYAVIFGGFRTKDVISYLKCHMTGIAQRDADRFEIYATKWKLRGKKQYSRGDFTMNPDGYTASKKAGSEEYLAAVNRVRQALIPPLLAFEEAVKHAETVGDHCRVLYSFLTEAGVHEALLARQSEAEAAGEKREAELFSRLFSIITEALDSLNDALSDVTVAGEEFPELLRLVFSELEIGVIPGSMDEVTVGNADMLRVGTLPHVYLFGVNEGEFPAPPTDNGVFSDADRRILEGLGLPLTPDLDIRASRALFSFLRAFSSATESVSVLSFLQDADFKAYLPSDTVRRLARLAGEHAHLIDLSKRGPLLDLYARIPARDKLPRMPESEEGSPLRDALCDDAEAKRLLAAAETPITDTACRVTKSIMTMLYGDGLSLSQSKMDRFSDCPFSYFCTYVLGLDENRPSDFSFADMGSFIHALLERLFRYTEETARPLRLLGDDELLSCVKDAARLYAAEIGIDEGTSAPRLRHTLKRLERSGILIAENLRDEFSESDFVPLFAEMDLSGGGDAAPDPVSYILENGTRLSLRGKIDRVDAYKRDGDVYLRVVDYKTGSKEFSLADVKRGKGLQLLLYLFTLWRSKNPAFLRRIGVGEGKRVYPAGVLYMSAKTADITLDTPHTPEEIREKASEKLTRNGLLLNDREILAAMEHTLDGRYTPVKLTRDGVPRPKKSTALVTIEDFEVLEKTVEGAVKDIGRRISEGEADILPTAEGTGRASPCEYCKMKPICRNIN